MTGEISSFGCRTFYKSKHLWVKNWVWTTYFVPRKHFLWRSAIHTYTVFPDFRPDRNKETLYVTIPVPIQLKTLLNNHLHITFMTQSLSLPLPSLPTLKWSHLSALLVVVLCFARTGGWSGNPEGGGSSKWWV